MNTLKFAILSLLILSSFRAVGEDRALYWGDTHVHTSNSFDAYLGFNRSVDPETAHRYAKGLPVVHPYHRARVQIDTPLDFLVIADSYCQTFSAGCHRDPDTRDRSWGENPAGACVFVPCLVYPSCSQVGEIG